MTDISGDSEAVGKASAPDRRTSVVYGGSKDAAACSYLWKPVVDEITRTKASRVFEMGCGNGAFARHLLSLGLDVTGVDSSPFGIAESWRIDPEMRLELGSVYDRLSERYGRFPVVVSLELIARVYHPRIFASCVADLLEPGGTAIIAAQYHGYFKNLALGLIGRMDEHFTALLDHGHIKFWSVATIEKLFNEQGLTSPAGPAGGADSDLCQGHGAGLSEGMTEGGFTADFRDGCERKEAFYMRERRDG